MFKTTVLVQCTRDIPSSFTATTRGIPTNLVFIRTGQYIASALYSTILIASTGIVVTVGCKNIQKVVFTLATCVKKKFMTVLNDDYNNILQHKYQEELLERCVKKLL